MRHEVEVDKLQNNKNVLTHSHTFATHSNNGAESLRIAQHMTMGGKLESDFENALRIHVYEALDMMKQLDSELFRWQRYALHVVQVITTGIRETRDSSCRGEDFERQHSGEAEYHSHGRK